MNHNDIELNYEIPMTEEKLRTILAQVEQAKKLGRPGQTLRIKLNADTILTFNNLIPFKTGSAVIRSSEEVLSSNRMESGLN